MTAAEDLLEIVMRRYERASTLLTSNRPVDDWGKLLGDSAAVTAMLDRHLDTWPCMKEAIEHGGNGSAIAEKFAPVVHRRFEVSKVLARS